MKQRLLTTPPEVPLSRLSKELYADFIQAAAARRYSFVQFRDFLHPDTLPARYIALRHDIDFAPRFSVQMAEIEHDAGIRSTFFVLTDGQFYDVLDKSTVGALRAIHALGHEVGLHFTASCSLGTDIGMDVAFRMRVLADIVGAPVSSFSQHDPVNAGLAAIDLPADCAAAVNAYDVVVAHNLLYVSDSAKMWRKYTFATALEQERNLCLLAHPHSWLQGNDDYVSMIREFQTERIEQASQPFDRFVDGLVGYYRRRLQEGV